MDDQAFFEEDPALELGADGYGQDAGVGFTGDLQQRFFEVVDDGEHLADGLLNHHLESFDMVPVLRTKDNGNFVGRFEVVEEFPFFAIDCVDHGGMSVDQYLGSLVLLVQFAARLPEDRMGQGRG